MRRLGQIITRAVRGIAARGRFSATDALLGVAVLLLCLWAARAGTLDGLRLPSTLEHAAYDYGLSLRADPLPTDQIVIVGIDYPSIERLGPWPWPRSTLAHVVEAVSAGRPITIGLWEPLSEPNPSPAIPELEAIHKNVVQRAQALTKVKELRALRKRVLSQIGQPAPSSKPGTKSSEHDLRFLEEIYATLLKELRSAQKRLDHDRTMSHALKKGPFVVVPMRAYFGQPANGTKGPLPDWAVAQALNVDASEADFSAVQSVVEVVLPLPRFVHAGVGVGHMALSPDGDGVLRMDTVAVRSGSHLWPSFALRMVAASSRIPTRDILVEPGKQVSLGEHRIPVDERLRSRIQFSRDLATVPTYSAFEVLDGAIPAERFREKLVLIGPLAAGSTPLYRTPLGTWVPELLAVAMSMQTMLASEGPQTIPWKVPVQIGLVLVSGAFVVVYLPWTRTGLALGVGSVLVVGMVCLEVASIVGSGEALGALQPAAILVFGCVAVGTTRAVVQRPGTAARSSSTERLRKLVHRLTAHSELPKTKEGAPADATIVMSSSQTERSLGRYEIIRELGRGAMGVVFLCHDPTIHRFAALKTLRLDQTDPERLPDIKARFFREAESAGRLSHPNIVTIYDAGEEGNLGYIVMEVLEGVDLKRRCSKDHLMPVKNALQVVMKVAEALDYAHAQGIVHRDIKPSNIMVCADGLIKVTDFGIARIMGASTETGIVLGTPGYMSPEQLAGFKVDGRSDIFSLGVVLFELLTGEKAFESDNLAMLVNQVANQPHASPLDIRPDLPPGCGLIIDRAMQKAPDRRYQRAKDMAQDLSACLQGQFSLTEEELQEYEYKIWS